MTNSNINCQYANEDAGGDKAGAIVGHAAASSDMYISNCTVSRTNISASRDAGVIAGCAYTTNVTGCTFDEETVTVTDNQASTGANINKALIGRAM